MQRRSHPVTLGAQNSERLCSLSVENDPLLCWLCRDLDLKKPIYQKTACYGHFGRNEFPWEVPKKLVF